MTSPLLVLPTLWKLGPIAVAWVGAYRLACRLGYYRRTMPIEEWRSGKEFFTNVCTDAPEISDESRARIIGTAEALLRGQVRFFGNDSYRLGSPPDWFYDPIADVRLQAKDHWSSIGDFAAGDIKCTWEVSRFQWLLIFAQAWRLTSDTRFIEAMNSWLADWVQCNPLNKGPNWKCGQEASIRIITLLLVARVLGAHMSPTPAFVRLIEQHCKRVTPTMRYAVAQNNNHGTSEAAALFVAGAWLLRQGSRSVALNEARRWRMTGRRWLEDRLERLVAPDGSFSQYSTNYHRVLIDTLSQVEIWRRELNEDEFTRTFVERSKVAVGWMVDLTDSESGEAPNSGHNDGTLLYDLCGNAYRDYRPSVQLASALLCGGRAYPSGRWDDQLRWLDVNVADSLSRKELVSKRFDDGGYAVMRGQSSWAMIRYARYGFRPSHCDCLHLDLWHKGKNILRDGGTFSYNTNPRWLDYFSGTESHNTVQFEDRLQMPRIGRFLFGRWLEMEYARLSKQDSGGCSWSGAYSDRMGARHRRTVRVAGDHWRITDELGGTFDGAVLRWRLIPAEWRVNDLVCESEFGSIRVESSDNIVGLELSIGWESLHYHEKTELPVLELAIGRGDCLIDTSIVLAG